MPAVVDWNVLGQLVIAALAGGLGLTLAFSVAIYGATRFVDLRRAGHGVLAGGFALLSVVALAVVAAGTVYGISILADKG